MYRTLWQQWGRVVLAGAALTGGIAAWGAIQDSPHLAQRTACQSNLKQLSVGLVMYTMDYDEIYPPAGKWATVARPYYKDTQILDCPADTGRPSYAMNRNLSGGATLDVKDPASVVMLFETDLHRLSASGTVEALARPPRHMGGNNYGLADGHVKWFPKPPSFGKRLTPKKWFIPKKRPQTRRPVRRR